MFEKIIEIIIFLMNKSEGKNLLNFDYQKLQIMGYSNSEISTALNWVADMMENIPSMEFESQVYSNSFRVLSSREKEMFTSEAWGDIMQMNSLGMINNEQTEALIDKAIFNNISKIDSKMVKSYVAFLLFHSGSSHYGHGRMMIRGEDTIN